MKKISSHRFSLCIVLGLLISAYTGCKKEDSSENFPPNSAATCSDGILNQNEFRIDCGGECASCNLQPSMSAVIDSFWVTSPGPGLWAADTIGALETGDGGLFIIGVDTHSIKVIAFTHTQAFKRGVYLYDHIEGTTFGCNLMDGIVEFTAFDTIQKTVSGYFSFNCIGYLSEKKERVIKGQFEDIQYK